MNKLKLKLHAVWRLLTAKGYIVICSDNPLDEDIDVEYFYRGFDGEQMILLCDSFAEGVEEYMDEEEDKMMSDNIGQGMINFVNLN